MSESETEHGICFNVGNQRHFRPIDYVQYENAHTAVLRINAITHFETIFEVFAESYVAFERELASMSIDSLYSSKEFESDIFLFHTRVSVRLLAVLSAARAYHDQRRRIMGTIGEGISKTIEEEFCRVFDNNFEYRVVELLRNYSQHYDLPIHSVSVRHDNLYKDGVVHTGAPSRHRVVIQPKVSIHRLLGAREKLQKKTVLELESLDKKYLDLKWYMRKYVSLVAAAHFFAQGVLEEVEGGARHEFIKLRELALESQETKESRQEIFLELVQMDAENSNKYADVELLDRLDKRRHRFRGLSTAYRAFISNELVADAESNYGGQKSVWIP